MKDLMFERARENAERGLKYLDRHHEGWEKVVPNNFDVRYGNACIVFHITGRVYDEGVKTLGPENPVDLGFAVLGDKEDPNVVREYAQLTAIFRAGRDNRLKPTPSYPAEFPPIRPEFEQEHEEELVAV